VGPHADAARSCRGRQDVDADLVVTAIMASIRGVGMQALVDGQPDALEPVMDALGEQILAWIRA
jgi:hypothetical protein